MGIYGVALSTVLAMISVGMPWLLYNLFNVMFDKNLLVPYLKRMLLYVAVTVVGWIVTYLICMSIQLNKWELLILRGIICFIVPNILYLAVYHKIPEFKQITNLINKITKGNFQWLKLRG